ncbi:hypothetical protein LCGC14_0776370 [marine sediment metagenome]|uniref:Tyr recombinase domain-containing protein n=1 Tax=marine sediment metagenome TaxID=412755 RepID=A0A0F9Q109_9ZZZZ
MNQEIRVKIVHRADRRNLVFRWSDPVTGESGEQTTGTSKRWEAKRRRLEFIKELEARRPVTTADWSAAAERYEREHLSRRSADHLAGWRKARNRFVGVVDPQTLFDLNDSTVSEFRGALHGQVAPASIDSYLRSLRAFAHWGAKIFEGYTPPAISTEKSKSKGRPLSAKEFKRMLSACDQVCPDHAGSWRLLLRGLAFSGLRLGQALELNWDAEAPIRVCRIKSPQPLLYIAQETHKGRREQWIPMIPPLVKLLRKIPLGQQEGFVFNPRLLKGITRSRETTSEIIRKIGQAAEIQVGTRLKKDREAATAVTVPKYASAHDLKRTFVQILIRQGLHPSEVMLFAQHQSYETTARHYAEHDATRLGGRVRELFRKRKTQKRAGAKSGDILRLKDFRRNA